MGMSELHNGNEATDSKFEKDEVETIINKCVKNIIGSSTFSNDAAKDWARSVVENCRGGLIKLGKSFKYIVNCTIVQKSAFGIYSTTSCYWDDSKDGGCTVKWENKNVYCIVTAYALAV
uniref:Dynein light chain n=1 Tax=Trichobilharzia regenti TaxID=157069 RepID=A0AA85JBX5_TRIRE|nr:unnamed protein product [Trichobilharzia regenti]